MVTIIERYYLYLYDLKTGKYSTPKEVFSIEEAVKFCKENKNNYKEIRLVSDLDDSCLIHIKDGELLFPKIDL